MMPSGVTSPLYRSTVHVAAPGVGLPERQGTMDLASAASFHEHGTFFAIWLLVMFVSIEILTKVRGVLEPLLWAFFLMMGLVPLTDVVEKVIRRCCKPCGSTARRKREKGEMVRRLKCGVTSSRGQSEDESEQNRRSAELGSHDRSAKDARNRTETEALDDPYSFSGHEAEGRFSEEGDADSDDEASPLSQRSDTQSERGDIDGVDEVVSCSKAGCIRTLAVVIVILLTIGVGVCFFIMVYKSALHMQESWPHYQRGAANITKRMQVFMRQLPDDVVQKYTKKAIDSMEAALVELVNGLLETTSHTFSEIVWVLLYMIFWLCQPVHIGEDVSAVFRRYIFLKGIASGSYAICIGGLLYLLGVDLAVVFGLITFVFNFVPEVGPFIAMMLPLPVILFDDRIVAPLQFMFLALLGQLGLKVVFGNIVEIKLIESQQEMRMHPVIILFFVAFFQYIWGATGMLLSVPIVAALKATLHKIPQVYRNPILIFLEGDKAAPAKWKAWRERRRREDNR